MSFHFFHTREQKTIEKQAADAQARAERAAASNLMNFNPGLFSEHNQTIKPVRAADPLVSTVIDSEKTFTR